jgi:hypothetical protein
MTHAGEVEDAQARPHPWQSTRLFGADHWQMTYGERAALAGLVSELRPRLAIEIGRAAGGSLECLAAYCGEIHSLDLDPPRGPMPANVHAHTGDSRKLLGTLLAELAASERNVDLALVDGDHSASGVRADLEDLLASPALDRTLIVLHDTMNDRVRRGIEQAQVDRVEGVVFADFEFVPGFIVRSGDFAGERWGGLGLVVVDREGGPWREGIHETLHHDQYLLLRAAAIGRPGPAQIARRVKAALGIRARAARDRVRSAFG